MIALIGTFHGSTPARRMGEDCFFGAFCEKAVFGKYSISAAIGTAKLNALQRLKNLWICIVLFFEINCINVLIDYRARFP
jgi:hypothetical protein